VCAVGYNNNNTRPGQYRKSPVMGAQTLFHDLSLCVCVFVVVFFSVFPNLTYILPHLSLIEGQAISDKRDNLFGIFSRCCLVPYYFVEISFLLSYIRDVIIPSIDRNKKKTTMRVCVCPCRDPRSSPKKECRKLNPHFDTYRLGKREGEEGNSK
jgi:hypothetical protein